MSARTKAFDHVAALLPPGEALHLVEAGQLKPGGQGKQAAKDLALSAVISTAAAALGGGGIVALNRPALTWVAITDQRFSVFLQQKYTKKVDRLLADFPLAGITVTEKVGLLRTVLVSDRRTGATLFRLNYGQMWRMSRRVVETAAAATAALDGYAPARY